jgi:hypothetical protein
MPQQATTDRMVYVGLLSSLVAGLIVGISARIVMRIVAVTARLPLQFTVATLNIIFFGLIFGLLTGFIYTLSILALSSSPKVRKYLPDPIWRGIAFGALLFGIVALPVLLGPSSLQDEINIGIPLLNKSMFAALPLIYGIMLGGAEKILDRYLPGKPVSLTTETSSSPLQEEE